MEKEIESKRDLGSRNSHMLVSEFLQHEHIHRGAHDQYKTKHSARGYKLNDWLTTWEKKSGS